MNEHYEKLDALLRGETWPGERTIRELVLAALSRARAEALEEAATLCDARADEMRADGERVGPTYIEGDARRIRAIITTPAQCKRCPHPKHPVGHCPQQAHDGSDRLCYCNGETKADEAPTTIPVDRVLAEAVKLRAPVAPGVLNPDWERGFNAGVSTLCGRLGVDLDAEGEAQEDEGALCDFCAGSGEGAHEGTTCHRCKGRGREVP